MSHYGQWLRALDRREAASSEQQKIVETLWEKNISNLFSCALTVRCCYNTLCNTIDDATLILLRTSYDTLHSYQRYDELKNMLVQHFP